ncbi:MAG: tRNA pseudouridine(55) synthase TruB [Oscillospiraceae bacterium]|nr:tRNA pseudouridine(55) synthase TruB [Oscillospiraceae bacterium]
MNGIIIIDKPPGRTSHDMVYVMRKLTGIKKIGHTGTLDPMATGVLPVCIGSATKAADMLTLSDKRYVAELILGKATDTQDAQGNVTEERDVNCREDEVRDVIMSFVGEIEQIPPMYSAIKKDGKKLYELARQGIETEREKRKITINSIDILEIDLPRIKIDVSCSKGTYIRTLCADIGEKLGTLAHMSALRRIKTGPFSIDKSYTVEELEELKDKGQLQDALISVDNLFSEYPAVYLNPKQVKSVTNGVRMTYKGDENQTYRVYDDCGNFLCVSKIKDGKLTLQKSFWS